MTTKLILATLVLGSSTLAAAAPTAQVTVTAKAGTTTVIRDHREPVITHPIIINRPARPVFTHPIIVDRPVITRPIVITHPIVINRPVFTHPVIWHGPVYQTVTLAADQQILDGRAVINVGNQAGRFGTIKLEADGGRTYVDKVVVRFADGERQVMRNLNRTLVGNDCVTLDLDGNRRAIASVAVFGQEMNNGIRYERGAFTLTAS